MFGLDANKLDVSNFSVANPDIQMGERLRFSFDILNGQKASRSVRIEFAIYLLKQNGSHSKKVFKVSERTTTDSSITITKEHHFKPITTRVYHPGMHFVSVILNGKEFDRLSFQLSM